MASTTLYPSTPEIKRLIAAVQRAGVQIGTIEIEPARVRIFSSRPAMPDKSTMADLAYDQWKREEATRKSEDF